MIVLDEAADRFDVRHSKLSTVVQHPVEEFQLQLVQRTLFEEADGILSKIVLVSRIFPPVRSGEAEAEVAGFAERSAGGTSAQ